MRRRIALVFAAWTALIVAVAAGAEIKTVIAHNDNDSARPDFKFAKVPQPSRGDAAEKATFAIVDGRRDRNGGDLAKLNDGKLPTQDDQPAENFFFAAGTDGGRLSVDLGVPTEVKQVNTYSWHPNTRGPQVYKLYAGNPGKDFNPRPAGGLDPAACGWKLIAEVDTRPKEGTGGGQYGVSISNSEGAIGKYQYLLFAIAATETSDPFGNTFFSEIDVIATDSKAVPAVAAAAAEGRRLVVEADGGKYQITIDTTETPDLAEWVEKELAPVVKLWYPKIVKMLPGDGYEAPTRVSITFSADMQGVAAAGGTRIRCAANWFRGQLQGEARGAVVHELVHVVQNYGRARQTNPRPAPTPGWLVEGIADYIRWFLYEPQTRGAEITARSLARARYDASYRTSANFLDWVTRTHDKDIVAKLNDAARRGRYDANLWKEYTGHTVEELGEAWKASLAARTAAQAEAAKQVPPPGD
jgi:hypothetical protein